MGTPLPDEARGLYELPAAEFTKARDALAKQLKADGDADGAKAVKALKRPTAAAAAINHLVARQRDDVEQLIAAGERLRSATEGGVDSLREASADRRKIVTALTHAALTGMPGGGAAHRDAVASTFEAASLDQGAAQRVLDGMLDRELEPPTGFDVAAGLEVASGRTQDPEADLRRADLEHRVRDREAALERRRNEVNRTEAELMRMSGDLDRARGRLADLQAELRGDENEVDDLRRELENG